MDYQTYLSAANKRRSQGYQAADDNRKADAKYFWDKGHELRDHAEKQFVKQHNLDNDDTKATSSLSPNKGNFVLSRKKDENNYPTNRMIVHSKGDDEVGTDFEYKNAREFKNVDRARKNLKGTFNGKRTYNKEKRQYENN